MAGVSAAATLIGGGISAYGAYQGGKAQKAYYDYQAGIQNVLANVARLKAGRDIMAGEQEAQKLGIEAAQRMAGINVRAGAANVQTAVGPTTGSTAAVYMSQIAAGQAAQAGARQTAAERAYGEGITAAEKVTTGAADIMAGERQVATGEVTAAADVASSVGQATAVALKWYPTTPPSATPQQQEDQPSANKGYYY
jgi:hypothetical protein